MKKKILFLSDVEYFKGGAENSLFDLMGNPNITPILVVPTHGPIAEKAKELNIPTHVLDFGNVRNVRRPFKLLDVCRTFIDALRASMNLKKIANNLNAKAIHTNGLKAHGVACLSRIIGGKPVFSHFRAIPFTLREKLYWHMVKLLSKRMIFVSRPCWHGDNLPRNGRVIFNGIDVTKYQKNKLKLSQPLIIGFAGRIQFTKGVDTLINWFEFITKEGINAKLIIRGEPAPDELEYDKMVRSMVKDKGLEKLCVFEGQVSGGIENIFNGFHLNVVPSVVPDPLPRSIMEASCLGLPVIGYPAGGIPYMLQDKVSGFLAYNKEDFLGIIKQLIGEEHFYQEISRNAFLNAQNNFSLKALHDKVTAEYNTAL